MFHEEQFDPAAQRARHFEMLGLTGPVKKGAREIIAEALAREGLKMGGRKRPAHEPMSDEERAKMGAQRRAG